MIPSSHSPEGANQTLIICTALLLCSVMLVKGYLNSGIEPIAVSALVWAGMILLIRRGLIHHPHKAFGPANKVTTFRAAGTALLAALIPWAHEASVFDTTGTSSFLWLVSIGVVVLLALDGVDGYLARRSQLSSTFGARFDMEVDAFLALVLALLIWRSGKADLWVLGLGAMRYAFVAASIWSAPLRGELFLSMRRKIVCVVQIAALCLMLSPLLDSALASAVGMMALLCLTASFTVDVVWLYRQARQPDWRLPSSKHSTPGSAAISDTNA